VVIKDIFRKYPNRYESIIATLCENLDTLDEPEAKASMIWIVGEYAERIDNADELLEHFLDSFDDETAEVQLQMLTATVKLFLKRPDGTKKIMENVLAMATEHSDNPDLRDRGYVYWYVLYYLIYILHVDVGCCYGLFAFSAARPTTLATDVLAGCVFACVRCVAAGVWVEEGSCHNSTHRCMHLLTFMSSFIHTYIHHHV
jgi:hypothetical protein